jgi:hypothetical protein
MVAPPDAIRRLAIAVQRRAQPLERPSPPRGVSAANNSAEEKGFEPLVPLPVRRFSKPLP